MLEKVANSRTLNGRNTIIFIIVSFVLLTFGFQSRNKEWSIAFSSRSAVDKTKVSQIHYLIPSTLSKPPVCASVVSALVNRYPIPVVLGYKGEDEFDSGYAHIGKFPAIQRYLHGLNNAQDDDLVLIMDSFDVLAQLPIEVMIERYFEMTSKADLKLASQRGESVEKLHELGIRQTVLWGAGKICHPPGSRCHLVPYSGLPRYAFGPESDKGEIRFTDPRHLNSGTVIGPLGDIRKLIDDAQILVEKTYDIANPGRDKDQFYISTMYARQEYQRVLDMNDGSYPGEHPDVTEFPTPKQGANDTTEYHIFVDFESTFTQTQCWNERWMRNLRYNDSDLTASLLNDTYDYNRHHDRPFNIQLPWLVFRAMRSIFWSLPRRERLYIKPRDWIQNQPFGTNIGTQNIWSFYHNTCAKANFLARYQELWFFPLVRPLLRSAKEAIQNGTLLHPDLVDGRMWVAPQQYPNEEQEDDPYGGVFTDYEFAQFIPLKDFCDENVTDILGPDTRAKGPGRGAVDITR